MTARLLARLWARLAGFQCHFCLEWHTDIWDHLDREHAGDDL